MELVPGNILWLRLPFGQVDDVSDIYILSIFSYRNKSTWREGFGDRTVG